MRQAFNQTAVTFLPVKATKILFVKPYSGNLRASMKTIHTPHLLLLFLGMLFSNGLLAQHSYFTRAGTISIFSSTPLEDVEAENRQVASMIDLDKGEIVFSVLIKSFQFPKALMQEHFNENYVESTKYPKASFQGVIKDPEAIDSAKDGIYHVTVSGDLTLHGVTRPVTSEGTVELKGGKIYAKSVFTLTPEDYNIKIPALVRDKIAKTTRVTVDLTYDPYLK